MPLIFQHRDLIMKGEFRLISMDLLVVLPLPPLPLMLSLPRIVDVVPLSDRFARSVMSPKACEIIGS